MSVEKNLLVLLCKQEFWDATKNILSKDMFPGEAKSVFETLTYAHEKFDGDIALSELGPLHTDRYPAMPWAAREEITLLIEDLQEMEAPNPDIGAALVEGIWRRHKAKQIGEAALEIYTGQGDDFAPILTLVEQLSGEITHMSSDTLEEVTDTLGELLDDLGGDPDFPFELSSLAEELPGVSRGDFGIIFARPETGKTTFCCMLAADAALRGHSVMYYANEEKAAKIKLRIMQAALNVTIPEMHANREEYEQLWETEFKHLVTVLGSVGTDIEEIRSRVELNKPDMVFIDQLDKVRVKGDYAREDQKLKALYVAGREIGKKCDCMVWAVSQAGHDAEGRLYPDYSMLDNSRTGKAGEADVIIGLGVGKEGKDQPLRGLCVSKNKINGWHGNIHINIEMYKGRFTV